MSDERKDPVSNDEGERGSPDTPGARPASGAGSRKESASRARGRRERRGSAAVNPDRPCMNCGNPAPGEYCSSCGQRKIDTRVSVRALILDVLEDQFILDKRLPLTLGSLFFRPGRLTVEHVNGRIVRYIHPFRLYLVSSLIFFLVLSFMSLQLVRRAVDRQDGPGFALGADIAAELDRAIASIDSALADPAGASADTEEFRARLAELTSQRRALRSDSLAAVTARLDSTLTALDQAIADSTVPGTVRRALEANRAGVQRRREVALAQSAALLEGAPADSSAAGAERETLRILFNWDENPPTLNFGSPAADSAVMGQLRRLGEMTPRQAAETITATFFDYVPIMMFVLLPVFAGVLKLLYLRRNRFYAEHFVFLLHLHSFVFFLATIILLLRGRAAGWVEGILGLWLVLYIYIAMMRVYGQGWIKTFAKFWTLGWMYFWILLGSTFVVLLAAILLF